MSKKTSRSIALGLFVSGLIVLGLDVWGADLTGISQTGGPYAVTESLVRA
ncbi:MAG: hypothetical protein U5K84_11590 [Alkalibacterium sp.]|nr:hypothetical protein [Alkalibacterium sp.]